MSEFIETKGLRKIYHVGGQKVEALQGVDLEIAKGDFVVFMGHSGSGKTTLVSTIGGSDEAHRRDCFDRGERHLETQ